MRGERKIRFGGKTGISERQAAAGFRQFSVGELASAIDPYFSDPQRVRVAAKHEYIHAELPLLMHLRASNPAVFILGKIIIDCFPASDLPHAFADRFAEIMDIKDGEDSHEKVDTILEMNFVKRVVVTGLGGSFTHPSRRGEVFGEDRIKDVPGLHLYQHEQILFGMPDFSSISNADEVLRVVGERLLIDYQTTVGSAARDLNMPPEALKYLPKGDPLLKVVHAVAGRQLLTEGLWGVMIDYKNGGRNNVFRPESNPMGLPRTEYRHEPQITERGECTASSLVSTTLQAMGRVILKNRVLLAEVMRSGE